MFAFQDEWGSENELNDLYLGNPVREEHSPYRNYYNFEERIFSRRRERQREREAFPKQKKTLVQERFPDFGIAFESIQDPEKNTTMFCCPICFRLVYDPKQCTKCDSIFCAVCVREQIQKGKDKCPFKCAGTFEVGKLNRYLKEQLMAVRILCPFSCGEVIKYEQVEEHFLVCREMQKHCKNVGCNYVGDDIESHAKNCEYSLVKCELCGAEVVRKEKANHDANVCRETELQCKFCKAKMKRERYNRHRDRWGREECLNNQIKRKSTLVKKYKKLYREELARNGRIRGKKKNKNSKSNVKKEKGN